LMPSSGLELPPAVRSSVKLYVPDVVGGSSAKDTGPKAVWSCAPV